MTGNPGDLDPLAPAQRIIQLSRRPKALRESSSVEENREIRSELGHGVCPLADCSKNLTNTRILVDSVTTV